MFSNRMVLMARLCHRNTNKLAIPTLVNNNLLIANHQNFTTSTVISNENESSVLSKIIKKVGFGKSTKLKRTSFLLYETVADEINYPLFFEVFNLPNTFNSWFLITELHIWLLLLRAMAEGSEAGEEGRIMRNCIVEALWNDVNTRAKKLGADNPSEMRRQIQILSQQFQAALITYDEGILSDDKILAGALWRRFFAKNCESYEHLEKLVEYVRIQVNMLDKTDRADFVIKPNFNWIPLKNT